MLLVTPEVDIFENEHEILLHAGAPGVAKEDIDINNGKMRLSGIRRLPTGGAAAWREFGNVEFRRIFSGPQSMDTDQVRVEFKDGLLCLHLPKSEAARPRQIVITAG